jgi:hypothetical protein
MGNPDVPTWLGKAFMRVGVSSEAQNRKDIRKIRSSSATAVIFSRQDKAERWMEARRCCERLALQAAALDLRTAFINHPVEVTPRRRQFATYLGIGNSRPDLVMRIGRAPPVPGSLRRPVDEVILTQDPAAIDLKTIDRI